MGCRTQGVEHHDQVNDRRSPWSPPHSSRMTTARFRIHVWLKVRRQRGKKPLLAKHRGWDAPVARARLLKPGFFANEDLCALPPFGRLLFAGLWTIADREGRLVDSPRWIKAQIFPFDNVPVDKLLADLDEAGFIQRYGRPDGKKYIQIWKFKDHQHPHPREVESTIPAPGSDPTEDDSRHGLGMTLGEPESGQSPAVAVSKSVYGSSSGSSESSGTAEPEAPSGERPTSEPVLSLLTQKPDLPTDFEQLRTHWKELVGFLTTDNVRVLRDHYGLHPDWVWAAVNQTIAAPKPSWAYYLAIMEDCMKKNEPPSTLGKKRDVEYSARGDNEMRLREVALP